MIPGLGALKRCLPRAGTSPDHRSSQHGCRYLGSGCDLNVDRRAAIATEHARNLVPRVRPREALRCSLGDAELGRGHPHGGDVGGAALPLAIAAMTLTKNMVRRHFHSERRHTDIRRFLSSSQPPSIEVPCSDHQARLGNAPAGVMDLTSSANWLFRGGARLTTAWLQTAANASERLGAAAIHCTRSGLTTQVTRGGQIG